MGVEQNHFYHTVKEITLRKNNFGKNKFTIELWTS